MTLVTDDDIALAHRLADAAGEAIRPYFRSIGLVVDGKADASPVTAADRAAEAAMRAILGAERPGDGVIGEEYGEDRPGAERVWVLDPIDGTRAFIAGRALFGTLIGLMVAGRPALGVIDQPVARDRWLGVNGGATLNGLPVRTRGCERLADAHVGTTSPQAFTADGFAAFERVRAAAGDTLYGGDCHNYGLVAAGYLDAVVEEGLKLHDWAALVPVVEGAGGIVRDWTGEPLRIGSEGRVVAAGNAMLLDQVLGALS